jgi:hypothetical protein
MYCIFTKSLPSQVGFPSVSRWGFAPHFFQVLETIQRSLCTLRRQGSHWELTGQLWSISKKRDLGCLVDSSSVTCRWLRNAGSEFPGTKPRNLRFKNQSLIIVCLLSLLATGHIHTWIRWTQPYPCRALGHVYKSTFCPVWMRAVRIRSEETKLGGQMQEDRDSDKGSSVYLGHTIWRTGFGCGKQRNRIKDEWLKSPFWPENLGEWLSCLLTRPIWEGKS